MYVHCSMKVAEVTPKRNSWVVVHKPNSRAKLRLFCFPYAGGGAYIYRSWSDTLPPFVEVCSIQLPGRGGRMSEEPLSDLAQVVEEAARGLQPYFDRPFAFFGHSMGALISYELARQLQSENKTGPKHLFVSAHRAPHLPRTEPSFYNLPDDELIDELRRLKGTPSEVLENPELMHLMLPLMRADFSVCQNYDFQAAAQPLACPITVFGGLEDTVTSEQLQDWRQHTTATFKLRLFPGDHFFLHTSHESLLRALAQELLPLASPTSKQVS